MRVRSTIGSAGQYGAEQVQLANPGLLQQELGQRAGRPSSTR
jgi:hypothetical protein